MINRKTGTDREYVGGLVHCLDDLEHVFTGVILNQIKERFLNGDSPEDIGQEFNRDPDEIFIALFHMARQGIIKRPFAIRVN